MPPGHGESTRKACRSPSSQGGGRRNIDTKILKLSDRGIHPVRCPPGSAGPRPQSVDIAIEHAEGPAITFAAGEE